MEEYDCHWSRRMEDICCPMRNPEEEEVTKQVAFPNSRGLLNLK